MKCLRCGSEMKLLIDPIDKTTDRGYVHLLWGRESNPMFRPIPTPFTYSFEVWICDNFKECGYTELRTIRNKKYSSELGDNR